MWGNCKELSLRCGAPEQQCVGCLFIPLRPACESFVCWINRLSLIFSMYCRRKCGCLLISKAARSLDSFYFSFQSLMWSAFWKEWREDGRMASVKAPVGRCGTSTNAILTNFPRLSRVLSFLHLQMWSSNFEPSDLEFLLPTYWIQWDFLLSRATLV